MQKSYYLAADGGGSKLQAVLYDENFQVYRTGRVAGVNTLFKPTEVVRNNIEGMMKELLAAGEDGNVPSIAAADLCMVGAADMMRDILEANQFSVGQGVQHSIVNFYICGRQFIQNNNNINIAFVASFATTITTLQANKPYTVCKGFI